MASIEEQRAVFDEGDDEDDCYSDDGFTDDGFDDAMAAAAAAAPSLPAGSFQEPIFNPNPNFFASPGIPQDGAIEPDSLIAFAADSSDRKRLKISPPSEERRLFQRLWTDEDEIVILEGFLEFTTQRGTTHANYQHDTGPFYEQIKGSLSQTDFNKNQLIEKLRRLKRKYRNVVSRMAQDGSDFAFKSPHEKAIYEIARNIWSSTFKRPRNRRYNPQSYDLDAGHGVNNGEFESDQKVSRSARRIRKRNLEEVQGTPVVVDKNPTLATEGQVLPSVVQETVKCCLSPLFKELLQFATGGLNAGSLLNFNPLNSGNGLMDLGHLAKGSVDEKWRKQQILELEVYLKRVELLEDNIRSTLEELRSATATVVPLGS